MTETMYSHLDELFKTKIAAKDNHGTHAKSESRVDKKTVPSPTWPDLPSTENAEEVKAYWTRLRTFYRDGQGAGILDGQGHPAFFPALLAPFRDIRHVRNDYPVWIAESPAAGEATVRPLNELLSGAVVTFAAAPHEARILKDNLARLEMIIRDVLAGGPDVRSFAEVLSPALRKMETQLDIAGQEGKTFSEDIQKLSKALPSTGRVAAFSGKIPFLCLAAAISFTMASNRDRLQGRIDELRAKLRSLLTVEKDKAPTSRSPEALKGSYGYGASFIDFDKFSYVLPESATEPMPAERIQRIERTLRVLDDAASHFQHDATVCVTGAFHETLPWNELLPNVSLRPVETDKACDSVQKIFEEVMKNMAELLSVVRIAALEIQGHYDPEIHDAYFTRFDWRSFTNSELEACPPVVFLTTEPEIMNHELADFSGMLSSCRPVKIMVVKQDSESRSLAGDKASDMKFSFQQEIGALAVSHRNTYVMQSTTIHPSDIYAAFSSGLSSPTPALFYFLFPTGLLETDPFLMAGAALEGRVFPEFTYDQKQGVRWGSRFNVAKNPEPDRDWPVYDLAYKDGNKDATMSLPFTVADYAALGTAWNDQFLPVPRSYWTDDLVLFSEYLAMPPGEAYAKVPYIWMLDQEHVLTKVATTHWMALLAQERLDFWHFVQEFGGINSYHVEKAVEQVRKELRDEQALEVAQLEEKHRCELEEARSLTARETMEKLSAILLDLDTVSVLPAVHRTTLAPVASSSVDLAPPPAEAAEEEAILTSEPWIETFRCTTCNECTNLNPNSFKYDANKQAYLADAKACTFAQLVAAAEKCTAKCIHPGQPLNPAEPGLDALLKRAAPFN